MKTVLVQAGHIAPREPGFESGTGTAGEQELVRAIRDRLVTLLEHDGRFKALPRPGKIARGTKCDAALFLHADGSANKSASGFSFGYPDYPVNRRLAKLIGDEFLKLPGHPPHHADNYTADLHGYYGFSRVDTPGPEVLVEHGFLTNPHEAAWLRANVDELAAAEYRALLHYFVMETPAPKPAPTPSPKVRARWQVTITFHDGRTKIYSNIGSFRLWTIHQANFLRRGVVDIHAHKVQTG